MDSTQEFEVGQFYFDKSSGTIAVCVSDYDSDLGVFIKDGSEGSVEWFRSLKPPVLVRLTGNGLGWVSQPIPALWGPLKDPKYLLHDAIKQIEQTPIEER